MERRTFLKAGAGTLMVVVQGPTVRFAGQSTDLEALAQSFRQPPGAARVHTWWHWMNGNITADGITRDLEAMARVGVGGVQMFDVGSGIPKGPVTSLGTEWVALLEHAISEAERLGLSLTLHNCPGWSSSGGPWVTPDRAMQQVTWSETFVRGGQTVSVTLPQPLTNLKTYRDAHVVAFPSLRGETRPMRERVRRITLGGQEVDASRVTDGDVTTAVEVRPAGGQPAYVQVEMVEPYEARAIAVHAVRPAGTVGGGPAPVLRLTLEASDDGATFRTVAELRGGGPFGRGAEFPGTASFAPTRARYFRLACAADVDISEIDISGADRLADWPFKANYAKRLRDERSSDAVSPDSRIDPEKVVDLTTQLDAQGGLRWPAPAGEWTILRIGYTPTGRMQNASTDTGLGLEIDKFSREAMDFHFDKQFSAFLPALRRLGAKGMAGALIDSYEVGQQNWTAGFADEFRKRQGYDLVKYLPALTGRIVGSVDTTERFLWDVRRAQADLMADNYWGRFTELCKQNGLASYTEPYGNGPFDEMDAGARVDVPMGEFWLRRSGDYWSVKMTSSIAHVFGKAWVGAEAFTGRPENSKWTEYPYALKGQGDLMYALGLTKFIFHRYAHQPHPDAVPGMTMGPWGFHFDRTNTWFEQAKPWLAYAQRAQHLLEQGHFVGDLLYFVGEDSPEVTPAKLGEQDNAGQPRKYAMPEPPAGHDYDFINDVGVLSRLGVQGGRLVLPTGASYQLLILPPEPRAMTPALARKLRALVQQGGWVYGPRPERACGLGDADGDAAVRRVAAELWGEGNVAASGERAVGRGRVFWGQPLAAVLAQAGLQPDFTYTARSADPAIHYLHRRVGQSDVYFVANRQRRAEDIVATFRVAGKRPELWDASTGEITPAPVYDVVDGRARVPLRLDPAGSVFVVFRAAAAQRVTAVARDGVTLLGAQAFPAPPAAPYRDVTNTFTVSAWVKPEADLPSLPSAPAGGSTFPSESTEGAVGTFASSFLFHPPEGDTVYGAGHTAMGVAVGRTGVVVYERARGYFAPVLVAPAPLSGWTHLAVVYEEGTPTLFLSGQRVRTGQRSGHTVHPGLDGTHPREEVYLEGDMAGLEVTRGTLTEDRLRQVVAAGVPAPAAPPAIEPARTGSAPALLVWENGRYTLRDATGGTSSLDLTALARAVELTGAWRVAFQAGRGAPPEITLPRLASLHRHDDPGVRYFSGTAAYTTRFTAPEGATVGGKRLFLDLGRVEVLADVLLNGKALGTAWKPPYLIDVTDAVTAGTNQLEVRVTNLWPNRLIGDEQLPEAYDFGGGFNTMRGGIAKLPDWFVQGTPKPASPRVTFTTWKHHTKDSPLLESGLLGPVVLRSALLQPVGAAGERLSGRASGNGR